MSTLRINHRCGARWSRGPGKEYQWFAVPELAGYSAPVRENYPSQQVDDERTVVLVIDIERTLTDVDNLVTTMDRNYVQRTVDRFACSTREICIGQCLAESRHHLLVIPTAFITKLIRSIAAR
jgi:hypothetical protein